MNYLYIFTSICLFVGSRNAWLKVTNFMIRNEVENVCKVVPHLGEKLSLETLTAFRMDDVLDCLKKEAPLLFTAVHAALGFKHGDFSFMRYLINE